MHSNRKILAIIPARGGSKGLPGKNIKMLCGKPLIAWSIEHARTSKYIDEIFVSTDSSEIANVAGKFGISVPFLRPADLAMDTSSSMDMVLHVVDKLESLGKFFEVICMLEPTSPLRDTVDIDNAIDMLLSTSEAESLVGICRTENSHPDFLAYKEEHNFIRPYDKKKFIFKRRQELDDLYFFEGSMYISHVQSLKTKKSFYHDKTLGFEMPKYKSFEVDDVVDFKIIEALMVAKISGEI